MPLEASAEFIARLDESPAPLAVLVDWTRTDSVVVAFTEHPEDIVYDGTTYKASTAMIPSDLASSVDKEDDNSQVQMVFNSEDITEEDVRKYRFDDARVRVRVVFWDDLSLGHCQLPGGFLGKISLGHGMGTFQAEMLALAHALKRKIVELMSPTCRYPYVGHLGTCKKPLDGVTADTGEPITTTGCVVSDAGDGFVQFTSSTLAARTDGFYANGRLLWTSGANSGLSCEIKYNDGGLLTLKYPTLFEVELGDEFTAIAGCDFVHTTCINKFNWFVRFGGEALIPGHLENQSE